MHLTEIPFAQLSLKIYDLWENRWLLLTAGDWGKKHFNSMTVGWGSFGRMWGKPFAQIVVRPTRYTYEFMEQYDTFTLCAFPPAYRAALQLLGSKSGRDCDKIAEAGLTPVASRCVAAPCYAEADLVLECRKIYWNDLQPAHFLAPDIEKNYPRKDYHRVYFGEIIAVRSADPAVELT